MFLLGSVLARLLRGLLLGLLLALDCPVEALQILVLRIYAIVLLKGLVDFSIVIVVLLDIVEDLVLLQSDLLLPL